MNYKEIYTKVFVVLLIIYYKYDNVFSFCWLTLKKKTVIFISNVIFLIKYFSYFIRINIKFFMKYGNPALKAV